jgi:hypothetical protein
MPRPPSALVEMAHHPRGILTRRPDGRPNNEALLRRPRKREKRHSGDADCDPDPDSVTSPRCPVPLTQTDGTGTSLLTA